MKKATDYMNAIIKGISDFDKECDAEARFMLVEQLEQALDTLDEDDFFGTEGWRHRFGLDG